MNGKERVAKIAAKRVMEEEPEILGVGSGSTVALFIKELAKRGFKGEVVSTSLDTTLMLKMYGFKPVELLAVDAVDLSVDGADEISESFYLIKGGGAAMLREKVLATLSKYRVYIADRSKYVKKTCDRGVPIPLEVIPSALPAVLSLLRELGVNWEFRVSKGKLGPVITDNGNLIIDLDCKSAVQKIELIERGVGVAASGLFGPELVDEVIIEDEIVYRKSQRRFVP